MSGDFNPEQKRYLEGFVAGLQIAKAARGNGGVPAQGTAEPTGPDAPHLRAQDRVLKAGGKLSDQEKFKRELHPFDGYDRLKAQAANNEYPKPPDNFRWRCFGLFYVAPNQNSYMCRLRMPNGILSHGQFAGIADLAERYGGGYAHITTRANLQVREIEAKNAVAMVEAIQDLGLCSRGSGADNIRNVTGSPTAGIDPQELIDTRPFAREWHFHILNERALYGLPRKFNVAFDGGGIIPVLEDTNDIGFQAVEVKDGFEVDPGLYFRLQLGGIIAFAIITETVFQWPGMGLLFVQAVQFADVPVMAAYLCLIGLIFVVINLVVDMLYYLVDPRLRVERSGSGGGGH